MKDILDEALRARQDFIENDGDYESINATGNYVRALGGGLRAHVGLACDSAWNRVRPIDGHPDGAPATWQNEKLDLLRMFDAQLAHFQAVITELGKTP